MAGFVRRFCPFTVTQDQGQAQSLRVVTLGSVFLFHMSIVRLWFLFRFLLGPGPIVSVFLASMSILIMYLFWYY